MRILVTGSRDWPDSFASRSRIYVAVNAAAGDALARDVTVVHGAGRGTDTFAHQAALLLGFGTEPHPAHWTAQCRDECRHGPRGVRRNGATYCQAAGTYRNQDMVDAGADVCLAFYLPGLPCVGTHDCDRRAVKAGIPVTRIGVS